jgi:hypothetical protein
VTFALPSPIFSTFYLHPRKRILNEWWWGQHSTLQRGRERERDGEGERDKDRKQKRRRRRRRIMTFGKTYRRHQTYVMHACMLIFNALSTVLTNRTHTHTHAPSLSLFQFIFTELMPIPGAGQIALFILVIVHSK